MRLLLAEDDELLGQGLQAGLRQRGFHVDWVRDGAAAQRELLAGMHLAAVLDIGLPRVDGLRVLHAVREAGCRTPVLVLTARDGLPDRIGGLDGGADDYVVKPVDLDELAARLRAMIRRSHGQARPRLTAGAISVDLAARSVSCDGIEVPLPTRAFDLLVTLLLNRGRVMSRVQLEAQVYGWGQEVESNAIEVHVHHLRRKLGASLIQTVRGLGYTIAA